MFIMGDVKDGKSRQRAFNQPAEVKPWGSGERVDSPIAEQNTKSPMFGKDSMEEICERSNVQAAMRRVMANKGAPGVDAMPVDALPNYLRDNWLSVENQLLAGTYTPKPVRRVEIPKPGNKEEKRKLGIPCVLDRLIQQATLQVLQGRWDKTFSDNSYGFRPGRSCHQAVAKAQEYIREGYEYVVDIDLEKFFDRICHDRLMSRLSQEIADRRVLKLIRSYMNAGIFEDGLITVPSEGAPQGGPLSPFLSNVVLDELDKELEKRGHKFVRYADDSNVYVQSERAGQRVMESIGRFITERLNLKVNANKSGVDKPRNRKILGFTFTGGKHPNKRKIANVSLVRFRARVRQLTRRNRSQSMVRRIHVLNQYLRGWKGYYGFCETPSLLRDFDSWIRRRLRCVQWKQWKLYRKRKEELIKLGIDPDLAHVTAWSAKGPWNICHTPGVRMALTNAYFDRLGLVRLDPKWNI